MADGVVTPHGGSSPASKVHQGGYLDKPGQAGQQSQQGAMGVCVPVCMAGAQLGQGRPQGVGAGVGPGGPAVDLGAPLQS